MPTQPEQMGNAKKMQELKCSVYLENSKQIRPAIAEVDENRDTYKYNVKALSEHSRRFNGLERASDAIESIKI